MTAIRSQLVGFEHVVGGQQDRLAGLDEVGNRPAQLAGADRVETDGQLVEEQDRWVVEQAAGDMQPLPHAARVPLHLLLLPAGQPDHVQQGVDPRPLGSGLDSVQLGEEAEVVEGADPVVQAPLAAEHVADPLANSVVSRTTS